MTGQIRGGKRKEKNDFTVMTARILNKPPYFDVLMLN